MGKKHRFDYFDAFKRLSELAVEESDLLIEIIENFGTAEEIRDVMEKAHRSSTPATSRTTASSRPSPPTSSRR